MAATAQFGHILRFGVFEVDTRQRELRKRGIRLRLQGQPLEVLILLAEHSGELVTREQLRAALWPTNTFVDFDHSLNNCIARLRDALDDAAESPRFIETVPRHGYRFVSPVERATGASEQASARDLPSSHPMEAERRYAGRRLAVMLACGTIIGAAALLVVMERPLLRDSAKAPSISSLAVLPLENLSGDASQNYFADGMTDELITELAKLQDLKVISRTSAMRYKGSTKALPEIARELGVDAIVEGSVVRSGDGIRVTAQLIRAHDDRHLWAQDYNRSVSNILQLQNDVAGAIAGEIQLRLDSPPTRTTAPLRQVKPEAYEAYLRAREREYNLTPVDLQASVDELKHAIALDPSYAFAYSALADVYGWQAGMKSEPPAKVFPLAREAALKALQLDSTLGEPHLVLAWLKHADEWDSAGARSEFETALRLTPSDAIGHGTYAIFLAMDGHPTEALAHARRAEELDPLSAHISSLVEIALMSVGQYDAALSQAKRTRELDPKRGACYEKSAWTYWAKTEYLKSIDAEEENDKACGTWSDEHHLTYQQRRRALSEGGVRRLAELHLKSLLRPGGQETDNFDIADTYAVLQDRARTLEYLKRACRAHDEGVRFELNRSQEFRFLRSDPQFRDILKKAGFSD